MVKCPECRFYCANYCDGPNAGLCFHPSVIKGDKGRPCGDDMGCDKGEKKAFQPFPESPQPKPLQEIESKATPILCEQCKHYLETLNSSNESISLCLHPLSPFGRSCKRTMTCQFAESKYAPTVTRSPASSIQPPSFCNEEGLDACKPNNQPIDNELAVRMKVETKEEIFKRGDWIRLEFPVPFKIVFVSEQTIKLEYVVPGSNGCIEIMDIQIGQYKMNKDYQAMYREKQHNDSNADGHQGNAR